MFGVFVMLRDWPNGMFRTDDSGIAYERNCLGREYLDNYLS